LEKTIVDISSWERSEHFKFFKDFSEPFFGVTVDLNCTVALEKCHVHGFSFFLYYLHKALQAANSIKEFAYRIEGDEVVHYHRIDPAPTVGRENNTFGFAYFPYCEEYTTFEREAKRSIEEVKKKRDLNPGTRQNVIYFSTLPWLNFTSLSHARNLKRYDSIPKISFGKLREENGKKHMPVSIHVNHALADGYHVGKFVDLFQQLMNVS